MKFVEKKKNSLSNFKSDNSELKTGYKVGTLALLTKLVYSFLPILASKRPSTLVMSFSLHSIVRLSKQIPSLLHLAVS